MAEYLDICWLAGMLDRAVAAAAPPPAAVASRRGLVALPPTDHMLFGECSVVMHVGRHLRRGRPMPGLRGGGG